MRGSRYLYLLLLLALFLIIPKISETGDIASRITFDAITFDDGMGINLRSPRAIFFDKRSGELTVADAGNNRILIYDRNLKPLYSFDHFVRDRYTGMIIKGEPKAVAVNSLGEIIVIDNLVEYLEVLDFRGTPLEKLTVGQILGDSAVKARPECLAIDAADNLYLGVTGNITALLMLDKNLKLIRVIGKKGPLPSELNTILAVTESDGLLYMTDLYSVPAIKIFDTTGNYISGFAGHDIEEPDLSLPSGIAVSKDSIDGTLIWVTDGLRQVVKVYNPEGDMLVQVGGFGYKLGEYQYPAGIVFSGDGHFFVSEKVGNRIQRFLLK
ncbi:MAG: hypothetical protein HRF51_10215 [bacterium]|jgi:DNA-binding beta-propeller fold protein YncE